MSIYQFTRGSGILLHPTSLPGKYGIGSLGQEAMKFIDFLILARQSYWQICPLGPTGYGDSPYQCFSAYAGNPLLIDLDELRSQGLLGVEDLAPLGKLPKDHVDFGALIPLKFAALKTSFERYQNRIQRAVPGSTVEAEKLRRFRKANASWLEDFALFMVLKEKFGGRPWSEWPQDYRKRSPEALDEVRRESTGQIEFQVFLQYHFFQQWQRLRAYAATHGIKVIGDLPIFVAYDSSDAWSLPELFLFDEEGRPTHVAGVPPDYFSATGQLWGNPLYDWDYLERTGFRWWLDVLKSKLSFYDAIRIDHFRGFSAFWRVPYGEPTAVKGEWIPAPGKKLFSKVKAELGSAPIIAEDLGVITDEVKELIEFCGFPGMKVLQFAFDSAEENDHLPHTATPHSLIYTGTHDNSTVRGWFEAAAERDRETARRYLRIRSDKNLHWDFIQAAMASVSRVAIFPLQDVLGLGDEARFNFPGTLGGNWTWRFQRGDLKPWIAQNLAGLSQTYGRA